MSCLDEGGYLGDPGDWDLLAVRLREAGAIGLDTEFYGVDLGKKSPVGRSKVHVWSVAVRTGLLDPRGYGLCAGWCLPRAALDHPGLRAVLEDSTISKAVHNQPVDHHALRNHGIELRGAINTLGLLRWHKPELINEPGRFQLKPNMSRLLGYEPVDTFKSIITYARIEYRSTWRKTVVTTCSCGVEGCRQRKGHEKTKSEEMVETVHERVVDDEYPLESIIPGHPRWERLVAYAVVDAVAALQFEEICYATPDPAPFPYGPIRPSFNQEAEEAVIAMEAVGIPVDVSYAHDMAVVARFEEQLELAWLFKWYVFNAPTEGPHRREDVDPIWSSPVQKVRLFDELGFPRSPIWQKGKVKPPDVKMDGTAMDWISRNHPPAAQLIKHLLHLQRIRSGVKYLDKLRDSGGMVHPTCGPSSDDDQRAGAVTGRLGVKTELEAQQLPSNETKDLYQIRKAIVA